MAEHSDPAGSEITVYAGQRPRYPGVGGFLVLTGATPLTGSQGPARAALSMLDGRRSRDDPNTSTGAGMGGARWIAAPERIQPAPPPGRKFPPTPVGGPDAQALAVSSC